MKKKFSENHYFYPCLVLLVGLEFIASILFCLYFGIFLYSFLNETFVPEIIMYSFLSIVMYSCLDRFIFHYIEKYSTEEEFLYIMKSGADSHYSTERLMQVAKEKGYLHITDYYAFKEFLNEQKDFCITGLDDDNSERIKHLKELNEQKKLNTSHMRNIFVQLSC